MMKINAATRLKAAKSDKDYDKKYMEFVKRDIGYLKTDIKEIEADGEDASRERKLLKEREAELKELQKHHT